jgi:hypothetical protein
MVGMGNQIASKKSPAIILLSVKNLWLAKHIGKNSE